MKKQTQCEAILAYLRKHKRATNMELTQALWVSCPHKRIADMTGPNGDVFNADGSWDFTGLRITRTFIKTASGKRVVQYRLERVK